MSPRPKHHPAAKPPNLRSGGYWSLTIGCIGLVAWVIGLFQYWTYGTVSIRPDRTPATGQDAVEMLIILGIASTLFIVYGI